MTVAMFDLEAIQRTEQDRQLPLYAKREIALVRGEGAYLFDSDGNRYLDAMSNYGVAVLGHADPEFAAALAERVVLLADGRVIADGPVAEVLSGGWYFATETARIVDGALLPEDGAELLRGRMTIEARP